MADIRFANSKRTSVAANQNFIGAPCPWPDSERKANFRSCGQPSLAICFLCVVHRRRGQHLW